MTKRSLLTAGAVALTGLTLAACGSDYNSDATSQEPTGQAAPAEAATGTGGGSTVKIAADPSGALAFTENEVTAKAGSDQIEFDNASQTGHNIEIEDAAGDDVAKTDTISAGKTTTTADLKPGTYTFYCTIPGHREAGMEGTLTVK